jgi:peptide/nickel transport system ATP-binding protein
MIYQEPFAALNPSMTIGRQLMEVPMIHEGLAETRRATRARGRRGRAPARLRAGDGSYPHQLSGGQQQRIVIAMALISKPSLLLLDEPTTALDVTVEAGSSSSSRRSRQKFGTAILFISHNLGLVREVCDRVCVMYSGEVIEEGAVGDVFDHMRHPYTRGCSAASRSPPRTRTSGRSRRSGASFPLPHERPRGCNFGPRCDLFVKGPLRCGADPDAAGGRCG